MNTFQNSSYRTVVIILIVLAGIVGIFFLATFLVHQAQIRSIATKIPAPLLPANTSDASIYTPSQTETSQYVIRSYEQIGEGIRYESTKSRNDLVVKILADMRADGWVATSGSNTEADKTIIKMVQKGKAIIIRVEDQSNGTELVSILPLEVNQPK